MQDKLLNVKAASEQLGISVLKLRLLMALGEIGLVRIGRSDLPPFIVPIGELYYGFELSLGRGSITQNTVWTNLIILPPPQ